MTWDFGDSPGPGQHAAILYGSDGFRIREHGGVLGNAARIVAFVILAVGLLNAEISLCRFNFGRPYSANPGSEIDFVSQWAGQSEAYNLGNMMRACRPGGPLAGKTPVVYSYIIAFTLRRDHGLKDCNVGTPNLCQSGATYLRDPNDRGRILGQVAKYAKGTAADLGTVTPVVWFMEPDFYQYAQPGSQGGKPLTFPEAAALMHEMLDSIQKYLPNARFSLDISPWTAYNAALNKSWYTGFDLSRFTYLNTSGGQSLAEGAAGVGKIRTDPMTWKSIHDLTGKPILADAGYGAGGASTGHDAAWDAQANLANRISDGVIGVGQANPKSDWNTVIAALRPRLATLPSCATGIFAGGAPEPITVPVPSGAVLLFDARGRQDAKASGRVFPSIHFTTESK